MSRLLEEKQERVESVAAELTEQGYDALIYPDDNLLPPLLQGYELDILAQTQTDLVAVIVTTRELLAKSEDIHELSEVIRQNESWQFQLVLLPNRVEYNIVEGMRPLNKTEVLHNLQHAEELFLSGFVEAGILMAWAATEAGLRLIGYQEEPIIEFPTGFQMLKAFVMEGVISRDDYTFLLDAMKKRNSIAHGYTFENGESLPIKQLVDTVKRLVQGGNYEYAPA